MQRKETDKEKGAEHEYDSKEDCDVELEDDEAYEGAR
jgi:hypothetical protein